MLGTLEAGDSLRAGWAGVMCEKARLILRDESCLQMLLQDARTVVRFCDISNHFQKVSPEVTGLPAMPLLCHSPSYPFFLD